MSKAPRWSQAEWRRYERRGVDAPKGQVRADDGRFARAPIVCTTATQVLWIPGTLPGWNQMNAGHWTAQRGLKRQWIHNIGVFIAVARLEPVTRAEIVIACVEQNARRDVDNVQSGAAKILLDALVAHGILADDSPRHVTAVRYDALTYDAADPGVRVTIIPV